jgi:dTDP-4-dehydrorhamnose reductase
MGLDHHARRVLVTGKDGQVGNALQQTVAKLGTVFFLGRQDCDLTQPDSIRAAVARIRPDIIINPAAYTAVDKAESDSEAAFAVNAIAPAVLAEEAEKSNALLVHYSTDYVFDGKKDGAYSETDITNPQSVYGLSKLAGEDAIRRSGCQHFIFRTSWVFSAHGANFLKTILRLAGERDALRIVADQVGAPTSAELIAGTTSYVLESWMREVAGLNGRRSDKLGTYHLVASGQTNWYEYAKYVTRSAAQLGMPLKLSSDQIEAIATADYPLPAARPANSCLDTAKLTSAFGLILPDWKIGLDATLNQLMRNT